MRGLQLKLATNTACGQCRPLKEVAEMVGLLAAWTRSSHKRLARLKERGDRTTIMASSTTRCSVTRSSPICHPLSFSSSSFFFLSCSTQR